VAVKVQVPKKKGLLVRFVLNPWGKAVIVASVLCFTLGLMILTYFYVKYSREVDAKLLAGVFPKTSMLFAAPHVIAVGDVCAPADVVAILRRAGYSESQNTAMGYYNLRPDAVEIYPGPDSYFRREPGVIKFRNGRVSEIISLQDNTEVQQYMLEPELITNLFDKSRQKRRIVKFDDIPKVMIDAVLAAEDKRFFEHAGFDPIGILRAALVDVREHRNEQGASTLTQQLARTLLLNASDRTWRRKIPEALMTLHLEQKLSKEQIFDYYANSIYLGQRGSFSIQGFGEGSQTYFGKDLRQISLDQAALLAGLIQSPNTRNPFRYPNRAKSRRNTVLGMMKEDGFITGPQYDAAIQAPLALASEATQSSDAPYFVDLVNEELESKFQDRDFQTSSYRVYTSLDMDLERDATAAVRIGLDELDPILKRRFKGYGTTVPVAQAALVAIDPHTGEIKALVGGRNYGASQLDRALSRRPPGSVFKPFVYTAAMNTALVDGTNAITPVTQFKDEPTTFYYDDRTYEPADYKHEYYGTVTVREALTKSLNVPTVEIAERVGYGTVLDLAKRAGLIMDVPPTPAIALGSVGETPIDVAGAYTIFANNGVYVKPNYIEDIRDQDGTPIFTAKPDTREVIDPRVAYMMTNLMEGVIDHGTGAGVRARGFRLPAAGKTGTSHDAWFAGYTSKLLCVVWVGFDDYRDVKTEGARAALPIWTEFMKRAHMHREYRNVHDFDAPDGIVSAEIDPESGELATNACPTVKTEVFIAGTQPIELCHLHGGAGTQIANWDASEPPPAQTAAAQPGQPSHAIAPAHPRSIPIAPAARTPDQPQKKKKGFLERLKGLFGK
jgi:penicillin-binding protein 1B